MGVSVVVDHHPCRALISDGRCRGGLDRDVRICLRLIVVNPMYDMRTVGFETMAELKSFGTQNAVSCDLRTFVVAGVLNSLLPWGCERRVCMVASGTMTQ